ncbi:MAG: hypothetical protein JO301_05050 [Chitinophagaceae bacterium]|nr:hypothetical protein [Chitinophagaceae bacterium]
MKTSILKIDPFLVAGALLVAPAGYFFTAAFLNYELHLPFFWDPIAPYFEQHKSLGWNANLLIAFGPVLAVLMNLPRLLQFRLYRDEFDRWQLSALLQLSSPRWAVIGAGIFVTGVMIAYMFGENFIVVNL